MRLRDANKLHIGDTIRLKKEDALDRDEENSFKIIGLHKNAMIEFGTIKMIGTFVSVATKLLGVRNFLHTDIESVE